jgi:predicted nucleic acid-binding protein
MPTPHPAKTFRPFAVDAYRAFVPATRQADLRAALVIPDTNVLLAPYRASTETLEAIRRTYQMLRSENRVLVPAQVAREFARNRLDLLAQAHKYVRDAKSVAINGKFDPPPILFVTSEYKDARQQLDSASAALKAYRGALDKLSAVIAGWHSTDPVLEVYAKIFDRDVVRELSIDEATLEEVRKTRYEARIPPGFRDKGKDDGGIGDLAIWLTILEAAAQNKRDAIFVTEETKVDWFHRSPDEKVFPRYELVESSRRTCRIAVLAS